MLCIFNNPMQIEAEEQPSLEVCRTRERKLINCSNEYGRELGNREKTVKRNELC